MEALFNAVELTQQISELGLSDALTFEQRIQRTLQAIRAHLGMEVCFVAEVRDGERVIRHVDPADVHSLLKTGAVAPLESTYCGQLLEGRLPAIVHDASQLPAAGEAGAVVDAGSYLGAPIRLRCGRLYGTLCCASGAPNASLTERDLAVLRVFAALVADELERVVEADEQRARMIEGIREVLDGSSLKMVYQPIYRLAQQEIVGFEALSRFSSLPQRSPDIWFREAASVGLGARLELEAIRRALEGLALFPEDVYVTVNISPASVLDSMFTGLFAGYPLERVVLELTEHAVINHYSALSAVLQPLRDRGLRIAVDDAGAGYASFRHILNLDADMIKLDISMTRNIDVDLSRRALAEALVGFAAATGSEIVAEGVETASELSVLRELGVDNAQGYFLGRPMSVDRAASSLSARSSIPA